MLRPGWAPIAGCWASGPCLVIKNRSRIAGNILTDARASWWCWREPGPFLHPRHLNVGMLGMLLCCPCFKYIDFYRLFNPVCASVRASLLVAWRARWIWPRKSPCLGERIHPQITEFCFSMVQNNEGAGLDFVTHTCICSNANQHYTGTNIAKI